MRFTTRATEVPNVLWDHFRTNFQDVVVIWSAGADQLQPDGRPTCTSATAGARHQRPLRIPGSKSHLCRDDSPRIESDLGFRVAGKVSKRLVEVGARVDIGQPLATLDEIDLRLQAEQAEAEYRAATGVLAQAAAAEARATELKQRGWSTQAQLDQAKATADEARARFSRAERSVDLTKNSLSYATLVSDAPGVVTATMIEPGQVVTAGQTAIRVARTR